MNQPIPKLTIQVTRTADGQNEYLQILSGDQFSVNVVLIAAIIEVRDCRYPGGPIVLDGKAGHPKLKGKRNG